MNGLSQIGYALPERKDTQIFITVDSETREDNNYNESSADFDNRINISANVRNIYLQAARIQGVPTIVSNYNDKFIIRNNNIDYTITLDPGRYAPDKATNTSIDNLITEIRRAINTVSIFNTHIIVDYQPGTNKISILHDGDPAIITPSIRVSPLTPFIGNTLGLGQSSEITDALGFGTSIVLFPYSGTWLVSKFLDISCPELSQYTSADSNGRGNQGCLIYRCYLNPPVYGLANNDVYILNVMHPKKIRFNTKVVGGLTLTIKLSGEDGSTFVFEAKDVNNIGNQLDVSLALVCDLE